MFFIDAQPSLLWYGKSAVTINHEFETVGCLGGALWALSGELRLLLSKLSPRLCHTHINKVRRERKPSELLSYFLQWSHRTERRRSSPLFLLDLRRDRMLSRSRFSTSASHRVLSSILSRYPPSRRYLGFHSWCTYYWSSFWSIYCRFNPRSFYL